MAFPSSSEKYLGENVEDHDKLMVKVRNVSKKIAKKKTQFDNMKIKITKLTELNGKLVNGYELSLKIVVDVSKLLQNYTKMFDDIEVMLGSLDDDMGTHTSDIRYISELTKQSIDKIKTDFNTQYPTILTALEKDGNRSNIESAKKLRSIVNEISQDTDNYEYTNSRTQDKTPRNKNFFFFGGDATSLNTNKTKSKNNK